MINCRSLKKPPLLLVPLKHSRTAKRCALINSPHISIRDVPNTWAPGNLGNTKLGNTEIGNTELGNTELGNTELGNTELGNTELGNTELGNTEVPTKMSVPGRSESVPQMRHRGTNLEDI